MHGIMFARVPGLWQYRQLRLEANQPDLWPTVQGLSFDAPGGGQPHGMPHGLFLSEADLVAFGNNPLPKEAIPNDAHNFIGRIGALLSPPHSGRTFIDRINDPAMQGPPPVPTFVLCFVPREGAASPEEVHRYLTEHVARPWSEHGTDEPGVHITVEIVSHRGKYVPGQDEPEYAGERGPRCHEMVRGRAPQYPPDGPVEDGPESPGLRVRVVNWGWPTRRPNGTSSRGCSRRR